MTTKEQELAEALEAAASKAGGTTGIRGSDEEREAWRLAAAAQGHTVSSLGRYLLNQASVKYLPTGHPMKSEEP